MNSDDVYGQIYQLLEKLKQFERYDISSDVENIITGGSTGTEILMGVRWKFTNLLEEAETLPLDLQNDVRNLVETINRMLDT